MDPLSVVGRVSRCHHLETILFWVPEFGLPTANPANQTTHSYVRSWIFTKEFKPTAGGHETWHGRPFVSSASCSQLSKLSRRGIWGKPQHASCTCLRVAGVFFVEDVFMFFWTKNMTIMTLRSAKTAGTSKREGGGVEVSWGKAWASS